MFKKILSSVTALAFGLSVGLGAPLLAQAAPEAAGGEPPGNAAESSNVSRDSEELRIYYSESLGAGQKVNHLTACNKGPTYQPVVCTEFNGKQERYKDQCSPQGTINYGKMVKGCDEENLPHIDPNNKASPKSVDPGKFSTCRAKPELHIFMFAKRMAVLEIKKGADATARDNPENIVNTIAWDFAGPPTQDQILKILYPDEKDRADKEASGSEFIAVDMYQATQCKTADVLIDSDGKSKQDSSSQAEIDAFNTHKDAWQPLIDAGCNNDNTSKPPKSSGKILAESTVLNPTPALTCTAFERLTGKSGTDLLARYVGAIYRWAAGIGGIIAVLVIVLSGIQMIVGSVDPGSIEKSKERITQSLLGLVLLFLSALILYTINPTFFTP